MVLVGRFIQNYTALLEQWAAWASREVSDWPDVSDAALVPGTRDQLEQQVRDLRHTDR
jgi:hypothetical protein